MPEAVGSENHRKEGPKTSSVLKALKVMERRGRFNQADGLDGAIGWVVYEEPIDKQTSERWNQALGRVVKVFKANPQLTGGLTMLYPPQSLLEKMTTPEERIEYLAESLERTAAVRNQIDDDSFSCVIDNLPINFNYDLATVGFGGTRVESTIADTHTGGLFRLAHLDFDILSPDALRINEAQVEASSMREVLNFDQLRRSYPGDIGDINVYTKKLINRLKHLQRTIREKIKKDRALTGHPNLPQEPGIEELLIAAVRKNLIAQGLLQEAADVEILDTTETCMGNSSYSLGIARDRALGRAMSQNDKELKTAITSYDFHRQPTNEDLGYALFTKIKVPQIIINLLLQRIPPEKRPTTDEVQKLLNESSLYDIGEYLSKLTVDYQMQFYPYWSVFRDLTEKRFAYGRRISGKEIEQLSFVKRWL